MLQWFKTYHLTNRKQFLIFNGEVLCIVVVPHRVPQGTVLGPLLFLLYIDAIVRSMRYSRINMFADDIKVYLFGKDLIKITGEMKNGSGCVLRFQLERIRRKKIWS